MAGPALEPLQSHTFLPPDDMGGLRRVVAALGAPAEGSADTTPARNLDAATAGDIGTGTGTRTARLVAPDGASVDLPPPLFAVLAEVARAMLAGRAVTVSPTSRRLTTQEAADLLGVSRPTLVKLLEQGDIAYERPGRHRRLRLDDVLHYQARRQAERRATLRELTHTAQDSRLYDTPGADYDDALRRARHSRD